MYIYIAYTSLTLVANTVSFLSISNFPAVYKYKQSKRLRGTPVLLGWIYIYMAFCPRDSSMGPAIIALKLVGLPMAVTSYRNAALTFRLVAFFREWH